MVRQRCGFGGVPACILQPGTFRLTDPVGIAFKRNEIGQGGAATGP
jgi:hypothetical protein